MIRIIATFLFVIPLAAYSADKLDCKNAVSDPEVNECAARDQKTVEKKLNATYQKLLKNLDEPDTEFVSYTEMRKKLIKAQRAWIAFREADCDTQFEMHKTGTIRTVVYLGCMQQRAEQRIKEFENYVPY